LPDLNQLRRAITLRLSSKRSALLTGCRRKIVELPFLVLDLDLDLDLDLCASASKCFQLQITNSFAISLRPGLSCRTPAGSLSASGPGALPDSLRGHLPAVSSVSRSQRIERHRSSSIVYRIESWKTASRTLDRRSLLQGRGKRPEPPVPVSWSLSAGQGYRLVTVAAQAASW